MKNFTWSSQFHFHVQVSKPLSYISLSHAYTIKPLPLRQRGRRRGKWRERVSMGDKKEGALGKEMRGGGKGLGDGGRGCVVGVIYRIHGLISATRY